jgi:hypothetical protein
MIVNDFVDVALVSRHCGIHLDRRIFRRGLPAHRDRAIGISTHNRQQFQSGCTFPSIMSLLTNLSNLHEGNNRQ